MENALVLIAIDSLFGQMSICVMYVRLEFVQLEQLCCSFQ